MGGGHFYQKGTYESIGLTIQRNNAEDFKRAGGAGF